MNGRKYHICPVEMAGILDSNLRRWVQNPRKILSPYIKEGMTVLDIGCGPGFFSIEIAKMVGKSGRVIAADFLEGMLQKLKNKIRGTELEERIILHKCQKDCIGVSEKVDFILAFYMVHEVLYQKAFFKEIGALLKPGGRVLVVEPPFHVSKNAFEKTIQTAKGDGFTADEGPKVFLGKTVIFKKHKEHLHAND